MEYFSEESVNAGISPERVDELLDSMLEKLGCETTIANNGREAVEFHGRMKFDAILMDTCTDGKYGGTGVTHDWELSKRVKQTIAQCP